MSPARVAPLFLIATACSVSTPQADIVTAAPQTETEPAAGMVRVADTDVHASPLAATPEPPGEASLRGQYEQGGWIKGIAPPRAVRATIDGEPLELGQDGSFFAGLDRDAKEQARLVFTAGDGQSRTQLVDIAPRNWDIERVNVAKGTGGGGEAWWAKREPEWLAIRDARARDTGAGGWRQDFIWPVTGRISGRFGRQRIYRGEPGSYHSGIDIAPGNGAPFVAPADGVVVLARTGFSLEGGIIIVDHGAGLNSAFIHLSRLAVAEGDTVEQGQLLGNVGASGRASGPHLHWSLMWRDRRLDPLLFLPPMS